MAKTFFVNLKVNDSLGRSRLKLKKKIESFMSWKFMFNFFLFWIKYSYILLYILLKNERKNLNESNDGLFSTSTKMEVQMLDWGTKYPKQAQVRFSIKSSYFDDL